MSERVCAAPGPGSWELETTHNQRPVSRFSAEAVLAGLPRGFAEGTARYGWLISHLQPALVNGFVYMRLVGYGADGSVSPEEMRARIETSARAFEAKRWRDDLARWDQVDRPAAVAAHRSLQDVDPTALSDEELSTHLRRCCDHLEAMEYLHHAYNTAALVPVGDFLAFAQERTDLDARDLMQLLRGTSRISVGFAADELDGLVRLIAGNDDAMGILGAELPAAEKLAALRADAALGAAAGAYLDAVWYRSVGYDVADPTTGELPELLVEAIRAAAAGAGPAPADASGTTPILDRVPAEHRSEFEERLGEARFVNRLRDERAVYSDGWATGLARRAVLEAGRRLHGRGRLAEPSHAVDADAAELAALLLGRPGPSADEMSERFRWRTTRTVDDAPPLLGPPPAPPPPLETLPPPVWRAALAANAGMQHIFQAAETPNTDTVLRGLAVYAGSFEGTARVVGSTDDFTRIHRGDVLVTRMTSPYFNVVLPLLGAIVTDRGGQLCHAAIVAREYGIPGVVGTREATRRIPDGARIRVDGDVGEVTLLP
ncbi:MAG: PEP-utilizing enzyme [Actinomycetes bacterium]